jgi:excisionase family DNA binding protein
MAEDTDIMSALDAASFLGAHVETIRRLARRGEIPSFKVGKDWRFRREALRKWSEAQHSGFRSLLVLTVDDDPGVCQTISRAVERLGCRAANAGCGRESLTAVAREAPGLILLDLMMPEMNGAELLQELRLLHPELPVAIITGYPDSDMIAEAMKYGPLMVLAKPVDEQQLKSVLRLAAGTNNWRL